MKKAKKGTQYFHSTLQTSPTKTLRVVGFDQTTHNQCKHFETTGNPVKLVSVREDNGQILVNQQSTLLQMSNSDVTFQYTPSSLSAVCRFHCTKWSCCNRDKKVTVKEFKFVDKLNIYLQCPLKSCNKKIQIYIMVSLQFLSNNMFKFCILLEIFTCY